MSLTPASRASRNASGPPPTWCTSKLAYASAGLLVLGGLVLISDSMAMRNASHHTYAEFKSFNSTVLTDIWAARRNWAALRVLGDVIECLSIILAVPPVMVLATSLSPSLECREREARLAAVPLSQVLCSLAPSISWALQGLIGVHVPVFKPSEVNVIYMTMGGVQQT